MPPPLRLTGPSPYCTASPGIPRRGRCPHRPAQPEPAPVGADAHIGPPSHKRTPPEPLAPGAFVCFAYSAGTKVSAKRIRMVAISARVAEPWGFRVLLPTPEISPASTAQATAYSAQPETLSASA